MMMVEVEVQVKLVRVFQKWIHWEMVKRENHLRDQSLKDDWMTRMSRAMEN